MLDSFHFGFGSMPDQAAGLRRLLGCAPLRVIAIAGSGATTLTVNFASALGACGMDVLVVDENANHGNVSDQLGISTRYELIHALNGERPLRDIICQAAPGVCVLPAARGVRELARAADTKSFGDCLRKAGPAPDLLLIDSAGGGVSQLLSGNVNCEIVIVAGARRDAITSAYSLIKSAAREFGDSRFRVIVNRARDAAAADAIFGNMAAVAQQHVGVRLEYLGWMPDDAQFKLARSAQHSVVGAFPASPAAAALRGLVLRLRDGHAAARETTDFFPRGMPAAGAGGPVNHPPAHSATAVFS